MVVQQYVSFSCTVVNNKPSADADYVVVVRNPWFTKSGYFYVEGAGLDVSIFFIEFWKVLLEDNVVCVCHSYCALINY